MKAILLVRVSTSTQDYEAQLSELKDYARSKGFNDFVVINDKESAIKLSEEERNGINTMKEAIENDNEIKAVFVWEISRLARTQKVLYSVRDYLIERKINLLIKDKNYILLNNKGEINEDTSIMFSLFGYFAETEMRLKKERFARARKDKAEKGKFNGGKCLYGYYVDNQGFLQIKEDEAEQVRYIFNRYSTGDVSIRNLTKECKLNNKYEGFWNINNLSGYLKNTQYCGFKDTNKYTRIYPQIISKELFDKCRNIAEKNNYSAKPRRNYLLTGVIKCPYCGQNYTGNAHSNSYICLSKLSLKGDKCCSTNVSISILEAIIWDMVVRSESFSPSNTLDNVKTNLNLIESYQNKISISVNEIELLKKQLNKLNVMFTNDTIDEKEFSKLVKKTKNEIKKYENDITNYNNEIGLIKNLNNEINTFKARYNTLYEITDRTIQKNLIKNRIEYVQIYSINTIFRKVMYVKRINHPAQMIIFSSHLKTGQTEITYRLYNNETKWDRENDKFTVIVGGVVKCVRNWEQMHKDEFYFKERTVMLMPDLMKDREKRREYKRINRLINQAKKRD